MHGCEVSPIRLCLKTRFVGIGRWSPTVASHENWRPVSRSACQCGGILWASRRTARPPHGHGRLRGRSELSGRVARPHCPCAEWPARCGSDEASRARVARYTLCRPRASWAGAAGCVVCDADRCDMRQPGRWPTRRGSIRALGLPWLRWPAECPRRQ